MSKWYKIILDPARQMADIMSIKDFDASERVKGSYVKRGTECSDRVVLKFKNKGDALRFKIKTTK